MSTKRPYRTGTIDVPTATRVVAAALGPLLIVTVAGQVPTAPASAATGMSAAAPSDVKGVKVKPVVATPRAEWTAADREVTEADLPAEPSASSGAHTVDLTVAPSVGAARVAPTKRAKVGGLPVYVAQAPSDPSGRTAAERTVDAEPVSKLRVELATGRPAAKLGVKGVALRLARADDVKRPGRAQVTVDYRSLAGAFGGDAVGRLRVVRLPDGQPVPSVNDVKARTITATVAVPGAGASTILAVAAAPQGDNGDYKATSLSAVSTWQVSQQTGSFTWSYPIKTPPALGGLAPSLALSYSSQSIDGLTSGTNTQGSWIGDGWDLWPGFIERSYRGCADDRDEKEKKNPNNTGVPGGDLCYVNDNATMSFNGSAMELVKVAASDSGDGDGTVEYRGVSDDGSKIELITDGRDNGDVDGSYWRVTTVDGVRYYFGRDGGQGGSTAGTKTDSVWAVPVYGNHPDEPGYDKQFTQSRRTRAWRWNLDYAVDPSGNTVTYFYDKETGAYAREGDKDKRTTYDRGGWLKRVEYGSRSDAAAAVHPAARVLFGVADRCVGTCVDGNGKPIARKFPDTPWDQYCDAAPCTTQFSPTFWTRKRLSTIRTQVYAGSGDTYTDVDSWSLAHTYLMAGVNEGKPMWLKSITHTGHVTSAGGPAVTDPAVVFDPTADYLPNRVDGPSDGHSSLFRNRIAAITTESGAQIGITYSTPECKRSALPKPHTNTKRCFPQYYGARGETPALDWFHTYVVTRVDVYDNTGGFTQQQTNYDYLDEPAWAYDDSELVTPEKRTWGQFRGYGRVRVRQGVESGVQSTVEYRYFRGMDGDRQPKDDSDKPPTGTPRDVQVTDSLGGKVDDHRAFAGMLREQIVYNGPGGDWVSGTLTTPDKHGPTATAGALQAWKTNIATVRARMKLSTGATRWTKTVTEVNADNLPIQVDDLGDEATAGDDRCIRTEYARNGTTGMLNRAKRVETVGVNCATPVQRPRDVLADTRTYYDDADTFGAAPTRGLPVRVEELDSWDGSTPRYVTTGRTGYDAIGRVTSQSDALNRTTATAYTPALAGPVTQTRVTNPLGHAVTTTLNPALGVPVKTTDANDGATEMTYDGAGRLLAAWAPGRPRSVNPDTPNARFDYKLRKDAASSVTAKVLTPYDSSTYRTSVSLFDGLLRTRQTQTQTVAGGRAIVETVHDSRGLVDWVSNPYYDVDNTAPGTTLVTVQGRPEIPAVTQNVYDGAGRPTAAIFVVNGDEKWRTTTAYAGEKTSVTPPAGGTATTTVTDARGRTTEVRRYKDPAKAGADDPATFDAATYTYTKRNELATMVDSGRNTWTYDYDLHGRKTADKDPDRGVTEYGYDKAGQLSWSKDARNRTLAYTYDDLGRRTSARQNTADGPKLAEWVFDTLAGGKGKPTRSIRYEPAGSTNTYTNEVTGYDAGGRPTGTTVTIPAAEGILCAVSNAATCSYTTGYKYRPNGGLDQVKYPAVAGLPAETVVHFSKTIGLPDGLVGLIKGGNQIYAQEVVYNQLDQLIAQNLGEYGTRVGLGYSFDEPTGRLTRMSAAPEFKDEIYDLAYKYDNAGNVTEITDTPDGQPAESQCFRYDHLRRLTEAWTPTSRNCAAQRSATALGGPAPYWRSYTYDATDNRRTEVVHGTTNSTRTYTYPAAGGLPGSKPHAVTQVATTGLGAKTQQYAYDPTGNMLCRPATGAANTCPAGGNPGTNSQTLAWDDEGRLAKSSDTTGDTTFVYDADGNRLIRRDPQGATLYLPDGTEVRKPKTGAATGTRYYSHAGSVIAVRAPAGITWMVSDHHGTGSATVSNDKNLTVTRRRTLPFGDIRGTSPATWAGDKGFVGGTMDNTGLTHLGAREYDPTLGRFVSVDPLMDLADPASWNGYAYANDNPVTASDPNGLSCVMDDGSRCGPARRTTPSSTTQSVGNSGGVAVGTAEIGYAQNHAYVCVHGYFCLDDRQLKNRPGEYLNAYNAELARLRTLNQGGDLADYQYAEAMINACGLVRPDNCSSETYLQLHNLHGAKAVAAREAAHGVDNVKIAATSAFAIVAAVAGLPGCVLKGVAVGGRRSFSGDTPVLLADGTSKKIKDVRVGDEVIATDPETGEQGPRTVTHLWIHTDDLYVLTVDGQALTTTEDHPFWDVTDGRWERADELKRGDLLLTPDGTVVRVDSFSSTAHVVGTAYNLTVDDIHTYYVLADDVPVLVHNDNDDIPEIIRRGVDDIRNGRPQRLNPDGTPDNFRGPGGTQPRITRKWGGSKIYDVEGGGNRYRILVNRHGDVGWIDGHDYTKIKPYPGKIDGPGMAGSGRC